MSSFYKKKQKVTLYPPEFRSCGGKILAKNDKKTEACARKNPAAVRVLGSAIKCERVKFLLTLRAIIALIKELRNSTKI